MNRAVIRLNIPGQDDPVLRVVQYPAADEPGFYPQAVSLSHFRTRELKRAFPNEHKGINSECNWLQFAKKQKYATVDWLFEGGPPLAVLCECETQNIAFEDIPVSDGVWQLYEDIGYDRKKQKYVA